MTLFCPGHLVHMADIRILNPDFCESFINVWLEKGLVAETCGAVSDFNLLMVFPF